MFKQTEQFKFSVLAQKGIFNHSDWQQSCVKSGNEEPLWPDSD